MISSLVRVSTAAIVAAVTIGCTSSNVAYQPLFVSAPAKQAAAAGTLTSDFMYAAAATTIDEAAQRWEAFLARYHGDAVEYEDGYHALRTQVAQMELARIYYIMGRVEEADRLLKALDPLGVL